jgi:hypothetical protein
LRVILLQCGTSDAREIFLDKDLTISLGNSAEANGEGRFSTIYIAGADAYKVILKTSTGVEVWSQDYILPVTALIEKISAQAVKDAGLQTIVSVPVGTIMPYMGATPPEAISS